MARKKDAKVISIQNIDSELWAEVEEFLGQNKRMRGKKGPLALAALESYLALAKIYGIDSEWHLNVPMTPEEAHKFYSTPFRITKAGGGEHAHEEDEKETKRSGETVRS